MMRSEREKKLEQLVKLLVDRLAVSLAYVSAIDDSVDPFCDLDIDKAWLVATLANNCKIQIFEGFKQHHPVSEDTARCIAAARKQAIFDIRDTELFEVSRKAIRSILRSKSLEPSPADTKTPA